MIDDRTAPYGAAILRITAGVAFLAHAGIKFFVFTPAGTMHYFASLGLPGWFGLVAIAAETAAGLALVLGFYARIAAILIALDLLGAIWFVHGHNGFVFAAPGGGGWEYPAFWTITLTVIALLGDGAWAMRPTAIPRR
jgi:putative oxidoreductase